MQFCPSNSLSLRSRFFPLLLPALPHANERREKSQPWESPNYRALFISSHLHPLTSPLPRERARAVPLSTSFLPNSFLHSSQPSYLPFPALLLPTISEFVVNPCVRANVRSSKQSEDGRLSCWGQINHWPSGDDVDGMRGKERQGF